MWRHTLIVFVINLTLSHRINKCCPENMSFHLPSHCVNETSAFPFSWMPKGTIINITTFDTEDDVIYDAILKQYEVVYGMPTCGSNDKDRLYYQVDKIEMFNFFLYEDDELRLHVNSKYTVHDFYQEEFFPYPDDFKAVEEFNTSTLRTFPTDDFCVDKMAGEDVYAVVLCPCTTVVCIRKCCVYDKFLNVTTKECESKKPEVPGVWRPPFKDEPINNYYVMHDSTPDCNNTILRLNPAKKSKCNNDYHNEFHVLSDGKLKIRSDKNYYDTNEYCGEITWHDGGYFYYNNLFYCNKNNNDTFRIKQSIYGAFLLIGALALLVTVTISLYLPELRRRIHNKIALCHNTSLMLSFFTWGATKFYSQSNGGVCIFLSLVIQFTFLSSFFWLNVMCVDIYLTFRKLRSAASTLEGERKKFLYYSLYSWGTSCLLSIVTLSMEFTDGLSEDFRPGMECYCGFNPNTSAILIYFYGPIAFVLLFNLILFIFTTLKILTVQRQTSAILHKTDSVSSGHVVQSDKQRLILFSKLFLLMGLTWVTEIVSWAVGTESYFWYISDGINLLRAIFIFVIFICKKQVYRSLVQKLTNSPVTLSEAMSSSSNRNSRRTSDARRKNSREESRKNSREGLEMKRVVHIVPEDHYSVVQKGHVNDSYI